jgi:hypothetical protein
MPREQSGTCQNGVRCAVNVVHTFPQTSSEADCHTDSEAHREGGVTFDPDAHIPRPNRSLIYFGVIGVNY